MRKLEWIELVRVGEQYLHSNAMFYLELITLNLYGIGSFLGLKLR